MELLVRIFLKMDKEFPDKRASMGEVAYILAGVGQAWEKVKP